MIVVSEKENERVLSLMSFGVEVNYPVYGFGSVADFFQSFLQLLRLRIVQHESGICIMKLLLISLILQLKAAFETAKKQFVMGQSKKSGVRNGYSMPHFLVIFTSRNITSATMMKVITATKKSPMPKF